MVKEKRWSSRGTQSGALPLQRANLVVQSIKQQPTTRAWAVGIQNLLEPLQPGLIMRVKRQEMTGRANQLRRILGNATRRKDGCRARLCRLKYEAHCATTTSNAAIWWDLSPVNVQPRRKLCSVAPEDLQFILLCRPGRGCLQVCWDTRVSRQGSNHLQQARQECCAVHVHNMWQESCRRPKGLGPHIKETRPGYQSAGSSALWSFRAIVSSERFQPCPQLGLRCVGSSANKTQDQTWPNTAKTRTESVAATATRKLRALVAPDRKAFLLPMAPGSSRKLESWKALDTRN